jgi:hypothetical protein
MYITKFTFLLLLLLIVCCVGCHRRNNAPILVPIVDVLDEDSVFVVTELLKKNDLGLRQTQELQRVLKRKKLRFKDFETKVPLKTRSGTEMVAVYLPPTSTDGGESRELFLLLKRSSTKVLVSYDDFQRVQLIRNDGIELGKNIEALCTGDEDICNVLLLLTHFRLRLDNEQSAGFAAPLGYNLQLKDVRRISDSASLTDFVHLLNDTALIPIPLPQPEDFIQQNKFWPTSDTPSITQQAKEFANLYHKTITEQRTCILRILTLYRQQTKKTALKELKRHYQDKEVFYFYSVPELAVYKIWYKSNKDMAKTAHIRLITGYRLWDKPFSPEFYWYSMPDCK